MGFGAAARGQHGLASREWLHQRRLDRLQRGDDPQHPRPRLTHASRRFDRVDVLDERLSVRNLLRAELRAVRAAVRARVLARLDRLPQHPGRVHARAGHRLLRELASSRAVAARVRDCESRRLARLLARRLGPDGVRRTGQHHANDRRPQPPIPHLLGARRGARR